MLVNVVIPGQREGREEGSQGREREEAKGDSG
jgi:hypothetical protein